jgi:GAF domain-containing protein
VRPTGLCFDALRTGTVIQADDLSQEERWNHYRPRAIAHGVASSLALPLLVAGERLGVLNLYSTSPAAFDGPQRQRPEEFAGQCAAALTVSVRHVRQAELRHQLAQTMVFSSIIGQAIGVPMTQQRCTAASAFDLLR